MAPSPYISSPRHGASANDPTSRKVLPPPPPSSGLGGALPTLPVMDPLPPPPPEKNHINVQAPSLIIPGQHGRPSPHANPRSFNRDPRSYENTAYSAYMTMPPLPPDNQPLTSATYIPGGESFGPGVGIPPLSYNSPAQQGSLRSHYRSPDQDTSDISTPRTAGSAFAPDDAANNTTPRSEQQGWLPSGAQYPAYQPPTPQQQPSQAQPSLLVPQQTNAFGLKRSLSAVHAQQKKNFIVQPAKEKQEYSSPAPQGLGILSNDSSKTLIPSKRDKDRSTDRSAQSAEDRAWPLKRVIKWLEANKFPPSWQDAFRHLNLYGTQFLNVGRPGGKSSLSILFTTLYPQIERECIASGAQYHHAQTREEGKRARRLIRGIIELGIVAEIGLTSASISASLKSKQSSSSRQNQQQPPPPKAPSIVSDSSPNVRRHDPFVSTPSTAGTGDDSPGRHLPADALLPSRRYSSNYRAITLDTLTSMAGRDNEESSMPSKADSAAARSIHEPSPRESPLATSARSINNPHHRLQALHRLSSSDGPSSDTSTPNTDSRGSANSEVARFNLPPTSAEVESSRSHVSDSSLRYSAEIQPSAKEHKGFLKNFMRRDRRKDDHLHEDMSPTSPVSSRLAQGPIAAVSKFGRQRSDSNHERNKVESVTPTITDNDNTASKALAGDGRERRYIMVTPDGWNYRLIDASSVDSTEDLKRLICHNLGLPFTHDVNFFMTSPGQTEHVEPLSDSLLAGARLRHADAIANLKIFVRAPGSGIDVTSAGIPSGIPGSPFNDTSFSSKPIDEATLARLNGEVDDGGSRPGSSATKPEKFSEKLKGLPDLLRDGHNSRETISLPEDERVKILAAKREEHMRETERKQKAYLASRRAKNAPDNSTSQGPGPGIRRSSGIIDFDQPRLSPYDDKRPPSFDGQSTDQTIPYRSAPPPPPKPSTTLLKANSLSKRSSQESTRSHEPRHSNRLTNGSIPEMQELPSLGYGRRLSTEIPGPDEGPTEDSGHISGRPSLTLQMPPEPTTAKSRVKSIRRKSPQRVKSSRFSRKSYGPSFNIQNDNVEFNVPMPNARLTADSDEDSDDGLFAVPIHGQDEPSADSAASSSEPASSARPELDADNDDDDDSPQSRQHTRTSSEDVTPNPVDHRSANLSADSSDEIGSRRRDSFASDVWANRPPAEALVEHLDELFPNVDLDQEVVIGDGSVSSTSDDSISTGADKSSLGPSGSWMDLASSSRSTTPLSSDHESDTNHDHKKSVTRRNIRKSGALGRTKSIREVVKGAYSMSGRPSAMSGIFSGASDRVPSLFFPHNIPIPSVPAIPADRTSLLREQGIARRKSTKMFGAKIEQIKPPRGSRFFPMGVIPDIFEQGTPTQQQPVPNRHREFKWMRGQLIGKGTFGRVYLSMNTTTGDLMAVKQVEVNPKAAKMDPAKVREMVDALDQEIDTMQHLDHEHIVQYLGCERKEFSISIFLEYISGGSIGSCLRKHGKFEQSVVSSLTRQTLLGLAYLHREGILHRDLKADNILLNHDGICKISDFGISKRSRNPYNNDTSNSMQGSVFWMAPEVIRAQSQVLGDATGNTQAPGDGNQGYSAKVDIWSLGCVVFEMLAGHRPWQKDEAIGAIYKLGSLNQAPPIPDAVSSVVSKTTMRFMHDCFTIDPAERPTAEHLINSSPFCFADPNYNFLDTELYDKIRPGR